MRALYVTLGFTSLIVGSIGIILPVLPTTPFYLLTLYFFSKGSKRFHDWFIQTKLYQKYLQHFAENKAMTLREKWRLMIVVDVMLLISFLLVDVFAVRLLIGILVIIKYWYFFTQVKTIKRNEE